MPSCENDIKNKIKKSLLKKALGYSVKETVKEYQISEGEEILIKKKVALKIIPPDITAAKMLIENFEGADFAVLSDSELLAEKQRLLELLLKKQKKDENENS